MNTTGKISEVNINGCIFIVYQGAKTTDDNKTIATPLIISIENQNFMPIFDSIQNAINTLEMIENKKNVQFMKIDNQEEFIKSIPWNIIRNPQRTPNNKIKFELIVQTHK